MAIQSVCLKISCPVHANCLKRNSRQEDHGLVGSFQMLATSKAEESMKYRQPTCRLWAPQVQTKTTATALGLCFKFYALLFFVILCRPTPCLHFVRSCLVGSFASVCLWFSLYAEGFSLYTGMPVLMLSVSAFESGEGTAKGPHVFGPHFSIRWLPCGFYVYVARLLSPVRC